MGRCFYIPALFISVATLVSSASELAAALEGRIPEERLGIAENIVGVFRTP